MAASGNVQAAFEEVIASLEHDGGFPDMEIVARAARRAGRTTALTVTIDRPGGVFQQARELYFRGAQGRVRHVVDEADMDRVAGPAARDGAVKQKFRATVHERTARSFCVAVRVAASAPSISAMM